MSLRDRRAAYAWCAEVLMACRFGGELPGNPPADSHAAINTIIDALSSAGAAADGRLVVDERAWEEFELERVAA